MGVRMDVKMDPKASYFSPLQYLVFMEDCLSKMHVWNPCSNPQRISRSHLAALVFRRPGVRAFFVLKSVKHN